MPAKAAWRKGFVPGTRFVAAAPIRAGAQRLGHVVAGFPDLEAAESALTWMKVLGVLAGVHVVNAQENEKEVVRRHYLQEHDTLVTDLPNRRLFHDRARTALEVGAAALLFLDLDGFKEVNRGSGYAAGDRVLADVARYWQEIVEQDYPRATLARMGGDEFAVLLPGRDGERVEALAGALLAALREFLELLGVEWVQRASGGSAAPRRTAAASRSCCVVRRRRCFRRRPQGATATPWPREGRCQPLKGARMAEVPPRPPRIFISYRRKDHEEVSAVLHARFGTRFGEDNVFRDVPSLPVGEDFVRGIPRRVRECDVLVVLIGPTWVRTLRDKAIEELDYVRTEIATALAEKKVIIPVCICGAAKPAAAKIHYQVRAILERNMVSLHDPLNNDLEVKALLDSIEQSYAGREGLREEVERLEEFPPAAGLALGYFVNFIREAVPRITALSPDARSYRHLIEVKERGAEPVVHAFSNEPGSRPGLKLHIVLPPTLDCLLPERLKPVMARLHQASIRAADSARPFVVDAWRHEGEFQLIDFPRTLGVLNTWLRRRLAKPPRDPDSTEWQELAAEEMRRFEVILKWWVEDPGNGPGFGDRVRVVRFTGQEPELGWLKEFWNG